MGHQAHNLIASLLLLTATAWSAAPARTPKPIRFHMLGGTPIIDGVYIDGHGPYRFGVDTGAQRSRISEQLAASMGWKAAFHTKAVTQTHVVYRDGFRAAQVRIGDVETTDEEFVEASFEAIRELDPRIQGFLGQSFLVKLDYLIDFRHTRLRFGSSPVRGGTRAAFSLSHGCMATETSQGILTLDSGATTVVLYDPVDVDWKGHLQLYTTEGQTRVKVGALKTLRVGSQEFRNVNAAASARRRLDETDTDGLLPASLFSSVYVSNSGGYVVFNPEP